MEYANVLTTVGFIIVSMLGIIGWFLIRFVRQYDDANKSHALMFKELLEKFDTLTEIIFEHKTDVEVIKSQINIHNKDLAAINNLYDRVRASENDIAVLKERSH